MRYTGFDPETAAPEDIDELETVISDFRRKLDKPDTANDLSMIYGEDFSTLESKIQSLETWCKKAKLSQKKVEDNKKKLKNLQLKDALGDLAETPRRPLFGERRNNKRSSRSRSKSREPKEDGKQSPAASVATSMRGGSKTHTMLISLERAMGLLKSVEPNFRSTTFKR